MKGAKIPRWADTPNDVREYIREAHARCTNISKTPGTGDRIHIGIIDSACRLPEHLSSGYTVNQGSEYSFLPTSEDDTNRHGTAVFRRLSSFAPDAEFSLYQVVESNRRLPLRAYADAITQAIEDDVDIVNLSAGQSWRKPVQFNPNVSETKRLLDNGIIVVAAAGNYFPRNEPTRPPVHCPSAAEGIISVAGLVVWCPRDPGLESATTREGPYYWLNLYPNYEIAPSNETFCGEQGCVGEARCEKHKLTRPWPRNPAPTGDKPDVLAPVHTLRRGKGTTNRSEYLGNGTSFATPLISGSLACIFSELQRQGRDTPGPYRLESAIRDTAAPVENSITGKYDAHALSELLFS